MSTTTTMPMEKNAADMIIDERDARGTGNTTMKRNARGTDITITGKNVADMTITIMGTAAAVMIITTTMQMMCSPAGAKRR